MSAVGRGLRRTSYAANANGRFDPEYAEVYGVPFSFIPCSGSAKDPKPGAIPTRVRALEERAACEIAFPRVAGYRYEIEGERLEAKFTEDSRLELSTADLPTRTEISPIVGEVVIHSLDDLRRRREREIDFWLAKVTLEKYLGDGDGRGRPWLFPQLLRIAKEWREQCLTRKDDTFPQLLLLHERGHAAVDRIYRAIVAATGGAKALRPILRPYDVLGSTRHVDFDTTRPTWKTRPDKSHVEYVVADTDSWEQKTAQALEDMEEVVSYVRNDHLGFTIPYTIDGDERNYVPDFLVRWRDRSGNTLNVIVEVTGEKKRDKAAKVATARTLWVPAVNAHGGFGRWAFVEVTDPWDAKNTLRAALGAESRPSRSRIPVPRERIAEFCRKHHIRKLSLFGSVIRDDFMPDSDVDVLVEFDSGKTPGLAFFGMEIELSELIGRKVDLNTAGWLSPYFRDEVIREAQVVYVKT